MKKDTSKNVMIAVLLLIVALVLLRYTVFSEKIDQRREGLQNIQTWEDQYRADHPNATDEEVDAAFRSSIDALQERKDNYKKEHPGATDEDADKAFNDAWSGVKK